MILMMKYYSGITQKMLIGQIKKLIEFGLVDQKIYAGYPLKTACFLTENRGRKMRKAVKIMRSAGLDYMLQYDTSHILREKSRIV